MDTVMTARALGICLKTIQVGRLKQQCTDDGEGKVQELLYQVTTTIMAKARLGDRLAIVDSTGRSLQELEPTSQTQLDIDFFEQTNLRK